MSVLPEFFPAAPKPVMTPGHADGTREAALQLEATFLAEMLKHAGFGEARSAFGGGVGEEQFTSFLRQEQAEEMARTGGIGLAETIFNGMMKGRADG